MDEGPRVRILTRIANDIDELGGVRRVSNASSCVPEVDRRLRGRRRLGQAPIGVARGPMSVPLGRRARDEYERGLKKAGLLAAGNPYRHIERSEK